MSDDTIDDIEDAEPDLDEDLEEDLDEDLEIDDALPIEDVETESGDDAEDDSEDGDARIVEPKARAKRGEDDEDVLELDEEHHPDDIEDPLDVLLKERTASASLEDDEEEVVEEVEVDDRGEAPTKIVPRRPEEFLCKSCFLVLPRSQLADEERMFCRDCA